MSKYIDVLHKLHSENIDEYRMIIRESMGNPNIPDSIVDTYILSVVDYASDILQRPAYHELIPFVQILNKTHIGKRIVKINTDTDTDIKLGGTYILDDILYDEFGNTQEYLIHNNVKILDTNMPFQQRVESHLLNGWVCIDDIGG